MYDATSMYYLMHYTQWEPTHEGISCKEFARWKIDNDPNAQEQGLAAHLHSNGIGKNLSLSATTVWC